MIIEVIIASVENDGGVYFKQALPVRVDFLDPTELHFSNALLCRDKGSREKGIGFECLPGWTSLQNIIGSMAREFECERSVVGFTGPVLLMPIPQPIGSADIEVIASFAKQINAAGRHVER